MAVSLLALSLAALIGLSLGLLGGGGSTLAVPILVYVGGMDAKPAIATSLLVVGTTSLIGAIRHWRHSNVELRTAILFGLVSMAGAYAGGKVASHLSDVFQLVLFAVVMLIVAVSMFRSGTSERPSTRLPLVALAAAAVGVLTGIVGVGGGFLIVPALVLFAGVPMARAIGTSLVVIAMNSAAGFAAYAGTVQLDWAYTALFTGLAIAGVLAGSSLGRTFSPVVLKRVFATFLIGVAGFILVHAAL